MYQQNPIRPERVRKSDYSVHYPIKKYKKSLRDHKIGR